MLRRSPRKCAAGLLPARATLAVFLAAAGSLVAGGDAPTLKAESPDEVPAFDVSHVPNEAVAVALVRPQRLRAVPQLDELVQDVFWREMFFEFRRALERIERPLERVEQAAWVQLMYPPADTRRPPQAFGVALLTSADPAALSEMADRVVPQASEQQFFGRTVFLGAEGQGYFQADDQTLVIGSVGAVRDYLAVATHGDSRLTRGPAWEAVADCPVAISIDPRPLQEFPVGPELAPLVTLREKADHLTFGLSVDAGKLSLRAAVDGEDPEAVEAAVEAALTQGSRLWGEARAAMMSQTRHRPEDVLTFIYLRLAGELIQSAAVEREENLVTLSAQATTPAAEQLAEAVRATGMAARREQSARNLRRIALAMHNYHDVYKTFPPPAIYDEDGEPLLSWRVALLPFVEEASLHDRFRLDEAWDSPHNRALLDQMPTVYRSPFDDPHSTNASYFALTGPGTVFPGERGIAITAITDGTSNTLLIADAKRAIPWTKPADVPYDPEGPLPELGGFMEGFFTAAMCDGSVRDIEHTIDEGDLRALIEKASGRRFPVPFR